MTPPKPSTEKELSDMEERLYFKGEESHGYHCQSGYGGECKCGYGVARIVIKELKRLRAGQARETSSKSEVKILGDAIIFEMASIATKRHRLRQGSIEKAILDESHARLFTALKQADAVKDEPLLKVGPEARKEANQFIQRMDSVASKDGPSND